MWLTKLVAARLGAVGSNNSCLRDETPQLDEPNRAIHAKNVCLKNRCPTIHLPKLYPRYAEALNRSYNNYG